MGIGDEIIASGQAREWRARHGTPAFIADRAHRPRWSDIWQYAPSVRRPSAAQPRATTPSVFNCSGARPYINYDKSSPRQWAWLDWDCPAGELISLPSDGRAANCVIIEPRIKPGASPNKQWPHWQALVDSRPEIPWAQMCQPGQPALRGVQRIETRSFIEACSVLEHASAAALPDGGLHHAAAALGVVAVVIQGGFIGPRQTGYATHRNLHDGVACGWRVPCEHCRRVMAAITPDIVLANLEAVMSSDDIGQLVGGVWLPATEKHFVKMMIHNPKGNHFVDGKATYQKKKLDAAMKYVKNFRNAVDIGAHVGLWAMWLQPKFQHLFAFEPIPLHAELFPRNVCMDNVTLTRCALGAEPGTVNIQVPVGVTGNAHVAGNYNKTVRFETDPAKCYMSDDIAMFTLDSFELQNIDFMKIDVEGYELNVVQGARDTLLRCKPVLVVESKGNDIGYGYEADAAVKWLCKLGYRTAENISGDHVMVFGK